MACSVLPYEGKEPYIFVSYSHSDASRVLPILEVLEKRGFRIWFDKGIELGTEWSESIAEHLSACTVCMAFISNSSVQSVNCRQEIGYAIKQKKGVLSVFLENTDLSMGLDMQLSAYQQIHTNQYSDKNRFYARLEGTPVLQPCRRKEEAGESVGARSAARKRKRAAWIAAAAVVILALVGAGLWVWLGESDEKAPAETPLPPYHVILTADEDCPVKDFNSAVNILRGRLDTFADGAAYEMAVEGDQIELRLPRELFGDLELSQALKCYFSRSIELFAFNLNDNAQRIALSREDLARVSLKSGAIEGMDAEALGIAQQSYPYIEIELTDECAGRIREEIESWGEDLSFAQDMQMSSWYYYYTYPTGDGKTFRILDTDFSGRYAEVLVYNLTHDSYAYSFYYTILLDDVQWEDAGASSAGQNQCAGDEFTEASATVAFLSSKGALSGGEMLDSLAVFKARLDVLGQPYAIGQREGDNDMIYIKTGIDHLGTEIMELLSTDSTSFQLRAAEMYEDFSSASFKTVELGDGRYGLRIRFKESDLEKIREFLAYAAENGGEVTLVMDNISICAGSIEAVSEDGTLTLDRLLFELDGHIREDNAWVLRLLECIANERNLPVHFIVDSCQFNAGADGAVPTEEDLGMQNQTLNVYQHDFANTVTEICPDAEIWFEGTGACVLLNLAVDPTLPEQGTSMAHAIYDQADFEGGSLESLAIYLMDEDNSVWERARIFFRKDYADYSYSRDLPDRMFTYVHGIFTNGRLEPFKAAFEEIVSSDPFYLSLTQSDTAWNFSWH
ncbi:MAG: toll/interleukin-1 receptor domain-containing protein [Aristaeellaceae bacterium]